MRIELVTPAPAGSRKGNRVTALRWAAILRSLGHRVRIREDWTGEPCDLLVALHASKSRDSVERFRREHPGRPLVLALPGTDVYDTIRTDPGARRSLEHATRIVVLQPLAIDELPPEARPKTRAILQSARPPSGPVSRDESAFEVCVSGHLRPVKDPFRAALAARLLPPSSRVRIVHVGEALDDEMAARARAEAAENPRYRWLGGLSRREALRVLARCRLLVVSSRLEGGANVVSEALAASVPVLSTRIPGSVGILGEDHPGWFPVGDTEALARLLARAETDAAFLAALESHCARLRPLVDPAREREAWRDLLGELGPGPDRRARDLRLRSSGSP
jgi:putative glycosyltransferase (TIGR04348 family)